MSDRDLVRRVRELGSLLRRAARWQGSSIEVDGAKDDFIYELLCYLTVGVESSTHFSAMLILRPLSKSGPSVPRFPRKPGYKKNFSFLILKGSDGKVAFELCPGIWIQGLEGKRRAPDINLLRANAGDNPGHVDLLAIWDAKYVRDESKRLADTAVSDFTFTFEELGSPLTPTAWGDQIGLSAFRGSGVLTNAAPSTEPDATLRRRRVSETSGFPKQPSTRP